MDNRLGWGAFLGSRSSSFLALVRVCKDSPGLREFGFGHSISLLALALILAIPHSASAQATATLNGVVRDSSAAVIPQATVTLQNTDTRTERESLTNDSGLYVFVSVQPGEYVLKVTKEGFTTATQGLHVLVNQASTLDFILKVGSTQQSVTVEASAVNLETGNATLGSVIESKQVKDLPLNGRNFTQLLALTPGVSPVSVAQNSGGAQAAPLGSFVFPSVSGQSNRSNYFLLDGIDNTDQVFTTYAVAPILDDIQEFKVQSHSDEAQFGGVLGGIVNVVTKSGTNNFHGTAWEFFRNTVLDAKNPLKSGAGGASKLSQNQFGANFGGPVILPFYNGRNKTFFFGSYEGFRRAQPSSSCNLLTPSGTCGAFYNVPTAAELNGDFSALLQGPNPIQLFNPFTTRPDPANPGKFLRDPFPNNDISSVLNPGAVSLAKAVFPAPRPLVNGFNGYDLTSNLTPQNQYSFRVDHNFNPSNSVFFRYTNSDQTRVGSGGIEGEIATGETFGKQYVLSYYHQFNPSTILDAQFGHVDLTNNVGTEYANLDPDTVVNDAGLATSFVCGFAGTTGCSIPGLTIGPGYATSNATNHGGTKLTDIYQWRANFTKVLRKHSFTSGFDYERNSFFVHGGGPAEVFGAEQTANPQAPTGTGDAMAAFLIGTAASASRRDTVAPVTGQRSWGFYFMDKWKVTDRLTVNVGLRYDLMLWPGYGSGTSDPTSQVGNIDFNNGTYVIQTNSPDCATAGQAPCVPGGLPQPHVVVSGNNRLYSNTYDNIQPRIGFAYSLNNKTVVRASFGMFNDLWAGVMQTVQGIGGDWPSIAQILTPALNTSNQVATANWQDPLAGLGTAGLPAPTPFGQVEWYRDPKAKNPYSEQWNFGVERQLGQNTVMSANYVGSQSHRLTVGGLYNVALTPGPGTPAEVTARQPFPYISPTFYDRSIGNSSYNAFQFSANHRSANGLTYLVAYTWSKSIDVGCSGFFGIESCSVQDPYNIEGDRSVSGFDLPHVLSASAVAPLPFGKGRRFANSGGLFNYIIGNWQLNGILTLTSGRPYNVYISSDIPNVGNFAPSTGNVRANQVGDPNLPNPSTSEWFNPSAFAPPAPFTFGNSGRNSLRANWFKNLDLSLFKDFPFNEKRSLQFRAEAFNLTNTPTWGIPVNDLNNPTKLGSINNTRSTERQLQLSLKLYF
jgi:Carboxypeptidase regulatory-like domain/TonB dependent receptor